MKLHRRGRDTTELLERLSRKSITQLQDGYVNQTSAVARILNGSLMVRQQSIWLRWRRRRPPTTKRHVFDRICPHYHISGVETKNVRLSRSKWNSAIINSGFSRQCDYCSTQFRIDEKDHGSQHSALFITQWIDLGQGRAVWDEKWAYRTSAAPRSGADWNHFLHGQVLSLQFENKESWQSLIDSILTLTPEDEAALLHERFGKMWIPSLKLSGLRK